MSKTLKRLVGLLLAAMMVLSFLPALAEGEEPIVITVGGRNEYGTDVNEMVYMKYLEEKFNVDFQCDWFYTNDAIETQFTLMLADDNLPDLMLGYDLTKLDCDRYGQEGFLLDLSQYLDIMPDFKAQLEKDPALNAFCRDINGAIYGIYKTRDNLCSREVAMSYMNKAWLERVGMDYPTTTEELYQVLKAFKERKVIYCNMRQQPYYEITPVEPDVLLKDFVAIFHPELVEADYEPRYYRLLR